MFAVNRPNLDTSMMPNTTFKHHEPGETSEVTFDKAQATYFNPFARMYVPSNAEELPDLTEIEFVEKAKPEESQRGSTLKE